MCMLILYILCLLVSNKQCISLLPPEPPTTPISLTTTTPPPTQHQILQASPIDYVGVDQYQEEEEAFTKPHPSLLLQIYQSL